MEGSLRTRNLKLLCGILLLWTFGLAGAAQAIPLNLLAPSYISLNGKLEFSNFDFHLGSIDPASIDLMVLNDGLKFSGPVSLQGLGLRLFEISYKTTALDLSTPITDVSLMLDSSTHHHPISKVWVTKTILGTGNALLPELKLLTTYDLHDTSQKPFDQETFHTPRNVVHVSDAMLLVSTGGQTTWTASTNRFTVTPEPSTASLLALGLAGLFALGSRRR